MKGYIDMIEKIKAFIVKNYLWVNLALLVPLIICIVIELINKSFDIVLLVFGLMIYFIAPLLIKRLKTKLSNMLVVITIILFVYTVVYGVLGIASGKLYGGIVGGLVFLLAFIKMIKQNSDS